jgi:hypothetical protein
MARKNGRNRGSDDRKGRQGPRDDTPRPPRRSTRAPKAKPRKPAAPANKPARRRARKGELVLRRTRPIAHRGGRRERANRRMIVIER